MKKAIIPFILAGALLISCKKTTSGQPETISTNTEIPQVLVTTTEKTFKAPDTLYSGYLDISFNNETDELHAAHLIRLDSGYTSTQLIAAYSEALRSGRERPSWMTHRGGVMGERGNHSIRLFLKPGNYTWVCVMGNDEAPHFAGHEQQPVVVLPSGKDQISLPPAAVNIAMTDSTHIINNPFHSGLQTVEITNSGSKYHLAALAKLQEGANESDLITWYGNYEGPPPAKGIYASSAIGPGLSARFDLELTPGRYVLYCMANAEGHFHLLNGAITTFVVE